MAENPSVIVCAKDVWTLVASDVVTGFVYPLHTGAVYYSTYRITGQTAPTVLVDEGVRLRKPAGKIAGTRGLDIYVWAQRAAGKVQVHV